MGSSKVRPANSGHVFFWSYTIRLFNITMENPLSMVGFMETSSINGQFSMAMSNNQMVTGNEHMGFIWICGHLYIIYEESW